MRVPFGIMFRFLFVGLIGLGFGVAFEAPAQEQGPPSARFARADRDGDGKLTPAELPRPALFKRLDRNGDGVLTLQEVAAFRPPAAARDGETETEMKALRDLAYGDHEAQRLDLYLPEAAKKNAPIMLYIHGGGWRKGDKSAVGLKASFFTGKGWLFASANYRLLPGGEHPKNVEDVASAIAWLHEHAEQHGGDPDKIFIMGHSAGCHLVSLVATSTAPLAKHDLPLSAVKGVIALDTQAYDVARLVKETSSALYTGVFGADPATQRDASPLHHVAPDKEIPPFLILYSSGMGARPNAMRPVYAEAFRDALRAAGIPAEVVDASDRNHGEINRRFGDPEDKKVTGKTIAFLNGILAAKNPSRD